MGGFEHGTLVLKATAVTQQMLYTLISFQALFNYSVRNRCVVTSATDGSKKVCTCEYYTTTPTTTTTTTIAPAALFDKCVSSAYERSSHLKLYTGANWFYLYDYRDTKATVQSEPSRIVKIHHKFPHNPGSIKKIGHDFTLPIFTYLLYWPFHVFGQSEPL